MRLPYLSDDRAKDRVELILKEVVKWAKNHPDIFAVALVGSHARGTARIDSDIDLMFLTSNPSNFRSTKKWIDRIDWQKIASAVNYWQDVDYGLVWSRHIYLKDETEIEFSFGFLEWASIEPIDPGTFRVVSDGCRILYDRENLMAKLLTKIYSISRLEKK